MKPTEEEIERRKRIKIAVYAYAYEFENHSLVSDAYYDVLSYEINVNIKTNRPDLDAFFAVYFTPNTGMWIHNHPELDKVKSLYERFYK